jgi:hypothetical protein
LFLILGTYCNVDLAPLGMDCSNGLLGVLILNFDFPYC